MIQLPINIDYTGKVVVVTGAGGLICGAMARAFAKSGAKVAALDINEATVKIALILIWGIALYFIQAQKKYKKISESKKSIKEFNKNSLVD